MLKPGDGPGKAGQDLRRSAQPLGLAGLGRLHGQNDVALFFLELENNVDAGEFIRGAKLNGSGGTDKIHRFPAVPGPQSNVLEIEARILLLKKNSHTMNHAWPSPFCAPA